MSLRGYCLTLSARIDCSPAIRMTRLDDDREDRPLDEEIGELHQLFSGLGAGLFAGRTELLICTAAPLRSLKTPEVTTSSPGLTPDSTATWSPRAGPSLTNCCRTPRYGFPSSPFSSVTTKTESPYGA